MSANLVPSVPGRRNVHRVAGVLQGLFLAFSLVLLAFPLDAGGQRGGSSAPSRGSSGGGHSYSGGSRGSSGGGRSFSAAPRSSSGGSRSYSAAPRSSSGGSRSYAAAPRSSSRGSRSYAVAPRGASSRGQSYTSAPRTSSSGERVSSTSSSRSSYGDRSSTSSGLRSASPGTRSVSSTGTRSGPPPGGGNPGGNPGGGSGGHPGGGGDAGAPPRGGHPGGGHPGGGHHGGGSHGWYCPPTYYGSSWYWGDPWGWWWGWGPYWGWGWGWGGGWGGVYVINEGEPLAAKYARIDTDVSPESAEVYLDGTLIGQADDFDGFPDYLYLEPGKYRLEFRHSFYETVVKELDVDAGQAIAVNDEMKLLPGKKKLQVVDPEDRGTPLGRVFGRPEAQREASASDRTGRFDVLADPDDLDDDVLPPDAPPTAEGPDVDEVAPAERSRLRFEVEPDDAAVYLDDRYVGTAEELGGLRRGFPVRPGKHVVTVLRPGYQSKTIEVETKPGAAIDVVIELDK